MKYFIELTSLDDSKIVINICAIQAVFPSNDGSAIYLLNGNLEGLSVKEKYEELLHILIPSSKPKEKQNQKVSKGVIIR